MVRPQLATRFLLAFPRNRVAGQVLCAGAWLSTAYEVDTIGIEVFDRIVRRLWFLSSDIPGMVWILAIVLTVLTCLWMDNLLSLRALSALFMLFPAELFPAVRLCDTSWRLTLVVFAYACAVTGMIGMFYPWHLRRAITWRVAKLSRVTGFGAAYLGIGALFLLLGTLSATGAIK